MILNGLMRLELESELARLGTPAATARGIFARTHAPHAATTLSAGDAPGLSARLLARLAEAGARVGRLTIAGRHDSAIDGFRKYLFTLADAGSIEAVRIPLPAGPDAVPTHHVVCVSSQAGCALGCVYCATGSLGAGRNLEAWEIVEQVARIRDEASAPVRGVVFMGMGEPLLNYDNVMRAAEILADPAGFAIARKAITISTAGVVPGVERFVDERRKHRLAISLTSAIPEKRRALMPIEKKYPLEALLAAARRYTETSGERVVLEYVMISGVNVGSEDALALIERLRGMRVRLNLIDVNDGSGRYLPPSADELARFRDLLAPLGQPVVRRYSGGKDIAAACGMLAAAPSALTPPG